MILHIYILDGAVGIAIEKKFCQTMTRVKKKKKGKKTDQYRRVLLYLVCGYTLDSEIIIM